MTDFGEGANPSVPGPDEQKKKVKCKWSSCKKTHAQDLDYPNNGRVSKGGYRETWIAAGMEPWNPKTYGALRPRLRVDRRTGKVSTYATQTYEYKTQAHHLIPTTLIKKTGTLKKNLKLIGYDCDAVENGMILPQFDMDMPLHELQQHLGSHPSSYMSPIQDELRQIEKDYDGICEVDEEGNLSAQAGVIGEMDALSEKAKQKILNVRTGKGYWPLRSDSLSAYRAAIAEYARREKQYLIDGP